MLGEALVELAKKPDPRIVLEVALVRLCRPDADRSYDAILDRLERLERSVADAPAGAALADVATPSPRHQHRAIADAAPPDRQRRRATSWPRRPLDGRRAPR